MITRLCTFSLILPTQIYFTIHAQAVFLVVFLGVFLVVFLAVFIAVFLVVFLVVFLAVHISPCMLWLPLKSASAAPTGELGSRRNCPSRLNASAGGTRVV